MSGLHIYDLIVESLEISEKLWGYRFSNGFCLWNIGHHEEFIRMILDHLLEALDSDLLVYI